MMPTKTALALSRIDKLLFDVRCETDWSADGRYAVGLEPTARSGLSEPPGLRALEECRAIVSKLLEEI